MRIPMTPEAKAAWEAECREADKKLATEPLKLEEIIEDTDKYIFSKKRLERSPELKQKCHERFINNKEYFNQKHKEWYYRNHDVALAKQKLRNAKLRAKKRPSEKRQLQ